MLPEEIGDCSKPPLSGHLTPAAAHTGITVEKLNPVHDIANNNVFKQFMATNKYWFDITIVLT